MKEFFAMGGYAFYVWMSYGIALVVLVANLIGPLMQRRRLLGDIARRRRRERHAQAGTRSNGKKAGPDERPAAGRGAKKRGGADSPAPRSNV